MWEVWNQQCFQLIEMTLYSITTYELSDICENDSPVSFPNTMYFLFLSENM